MSDAVRLKCWVLGDNPDHIFRVDAPLGQYVVDLKLTIKRCNPLILRSFSASSLTLFKTQMARESAEETLGQINLDSLKDFEKLAPMSLVSQAFPDTPKDGHVYFIIIHPRRK
jgi:hypothetical protein